MAIDHIIDYDCVPKQTLATEGLLERLKGQQRADFIIDLLRQQGDNRPVDQLDFEFTRSTPEGHTEKQVILVKDLLDAAAELQPLRHHCAGCPANRTGEPFGCIGFVQYPVSAEGEGWLIDRLPVPDEPLVWLLLRQGIKEFNYDGQMIVPLRGGADSHYFESPQPLTRRLGELEVNSNQVFEMIFGVGNIIPNHAALLLLFFQAIDRDLEADQIMTITPSPPDVDIHHPFMLSVAESDDRSVRDFKHFFHALWLAWKLNIRLLVDA